MGRKCWTPNCKFNYNTEKQHTTVFEFSTDNKKENLWLRKLHHDNFIPSAIAVVSIKYFSERFIIHAHLLCHEYGYLLFMVGIIKYI